MRIDGKSSTEWWNFFGHNKQPQYLSNYIESILTGYKLIIQYSSNELPVTDSSVCRKLSKNRDNSDDQVCFTAVHSSVASLFGQLKNCVPSPGPDLSPRS